MLRSVIILFFSYPRRAVSVIHKSCGTSIPRSHAGASMPLS